MHNSEKHGIVCKWMGKHEKALESSGDFVFSCQDVPSYLTIIINQLILINYFKNSLYWSVNYYKLLCASP